MVTNQTRTESHHDCPHPFRAQPHRHAAHRRRAHRAVQLAVRAPEHGGTFILRVEDTDRERSTDEAVQVILDGMEWLGLEADEGPYYQTQRFDRYREVIAQMLRDGKAYRCYCSKEELDAMRTRAAGAQGKAALRRPLPRPHRARGPASTRWCASRIR